jgi:hypothetical protein
LAVAVSRRRCGLHGMAQRARCSICEPSPMTSPTDPITARGKPGCRLSGSYLHPRSAALRLQKRSDDMPGPGLLQTKGRSPGVQASICRA